MVSGVRRNAVVDAILAVVAMLSCMIFAFGLLDTPRQALQIDSIASLPEGIERDAELGVTVIASAARPIPGAEVRVFWQRERSYYLAGRALADAEGRVHFDRLARGVVWVVVHKQGFARTSTELALAAAPREARHNMGAAHADDVE
jgi:hypothetical protein